MAELNFRIRTSASILLAAAAAAAAAACDLMDPRQDRCFALYH